MRREQAAALALGISVELATLAALAGVLYAINLIRSHLRHTPPPPWTDGTDL